MRRPLWSHWIWLSLLLLGWAHAQEAVEEGAEVKPPDELSGASATSGAVHTVVPGDTLWDLSSQYLGTPWYWPKVWSQNPEIANPHWIYPGNLVRFAPMGEEGPVRVDVSEVSSAEQGGTLGTLGGLEEEGKVYVEGQIGYVPKRSPRVNTIGFATAKELDLAGRLEGSFGETQMLSHLDKVYLRFKKPGEVAVGREFVVYRREPEPLRHPLTQAKMGFLTTFVGTVKVTALTKPLITAVVTQSFDELNIGDWVGPSGEQVIRDVILAPNEKSLEGVVVTSLMPVMTHIGEHQSIIVDKGAADGVRRGNTFDILRRGGDELRGFLGITASPSSKDLPLENIGTCVAQEVKERASTCLMIQSLREVMAGDAVVMKPSSRSEPRASVP